MRPVFNLFVGSRKAITKIKMVLFLFLLVMMVSPSLWAATIYVDASNSGTETGSSWLTAFSDIQSAVDVAESGDEIWVKDGTYTRTPDFTYDHWVVTNSGKSISFYGGFPSDVSSPGWGDRDWANNATIITGNGETGDNWVRGFSFSGEPVIVDGFIITDCAGDAYGGGGIRLTYMSGTSTIRNCVVKDNIGLDHCTGGGVQVANSANASVNLVGCLISGNTAQQGGGIYLYTTSTSADYSVNIINCTIAGNTATGTTTTDYGGGIYNNNSYMNIRNSIIWGNTTAVAAGPGLYETTLGAQRSTVSYTLIQGGYSGTGNLNQDPIFISGIDYQISSSSPCVDSGSNGALPADIDDLDEDGDVDESLPFDLNAGERVVDGDGYSGAVVDMGSYEYASTVSLTLRVVRTSFSEGESAWECALDISDAQATAIDVSLASSDDTEITVPSSVTIPAGLTTVFFNMTIVDDNEIDGRQYATISASASGLVADTSDVIEILDNESKELTLNVPPSATEGDDVLADHGFVHLSGTLSTPTDVYLSSSDNSEVELPEYVTIGANTLNASFWIRVLDDSDVDGTANVTITAWIPSDNDFNAAYGTISVADNEVPPTMYTLNVDVSGQGNTNPAPGASNYAEGSEVSILATPAEGWRFDGWSGDVTGTSNPVSVTMDGSKNVTASFSEIPPNYDLTVVSDGAGTVNINPPGLTYESGTTVHLEALPDEGYVFVEWIGDVADLDSSTTSVVMTSNKNVTAVFRTDGDNDGISDESEFGPSGVDINYDGNGDGIADSEQLNVASGYVGDDQYYITLAHENPADHSSINGDLANIEVDDAQNTPPGYDLPYGVLSFSVSGIGIGGETTVVLYYNDGPVPSTYWKYGPTPLDQTDHWYEFLYDGQTGAEIDTAGNRIILHFVDGERGDDNVLAPDGDIADDGGPGIESSVSGSSTGGSSSNGSCFINTIIF